MNPKVSVDDFGYLVRQVGSFFEVTKWGFRTEPEALYTVRCRRDRWDCDSPGCRHKPKCKHAQLVDRWIKSNPVRTEMPTMFLRIED